MASNRPGAALGPIDWRLTVAVCLCAALPVFLVSFPPLNDYPFHLARFDILARYAGSDFLQRIYNPPNYLLPNVGGDVLAVVLAWMMPVERAGRVVVAAVIILQISGVCVLHYAVWRRLSPWPFVSVLLAYNFILLFGFLNYGIGVGLALWGVAVHLVLLGRPIWVRCLAGAAIALVVYFAHLAAFGLYALLIATLRTSELLREARQNRAWPDIRQVLPEALPLAPPLLLLLNSPPVQYGGLSFSHPLEVSFSWFIKTKLGAAVSLLSFGNFWLDVAHLVTWITVLGVIAVLARPRFHPSLWLFLTVGTLAFLVAPHSALTGGYVEARIPMFLAFSAVAFVDLNPRNAQAFRRLTIVLTTAALVRTFAVAFAWYSSQPPLEEVVQALRRLPAGSFVFTASLDPAPGISRFWDQNWAPPMKHVVSYAGLGRDLFVPATWAHPAQQPISVRPDVQAAYLAQGVNPPVITDSAHLSQVAARFRGSMDSGPAYLLLLGAPTPVIALRDADAVARGQRFLLMPLP